MRLRWRAQFGIHRTRQCGRLVSERRIPDVEAGRVSPAGAGRPVVRRACRLIFNGRLPDRIPLRREFLRAANAGTKMPTSTHEGVKAGPKNLPIKLVSSLIRSMARPLPASHNAGLDERNQAGLLAPR